MWRFGRHCSAPASVNTPIWSFLRLNMYFLPSSSRAMYFALSVSVMPLMKDEALGSVFCMDLFIRLGERAKLFALAVAFKSTLLRLLFLDFDCMGEPKSTDTCSGALFFGTDNITKPM